MSSYEYAQLFDFFCFYFFFAQQCISIITTTICENLSCAHVCADPEFKYTLIKKNKQKNLQFLGDFPSHLNIKMPISQPTDKINVCCGYSFSSLEHRIILYIFYFDALKFLFWFCSCKVEWVGYLVRACIVQTYLAVLYKFLARRQKAIIKSSAL